MVPFNRMKGTSPWFLTGRLSRVQSRTDVSRFSEYDYASRWRKKAGRRKEGGRPCERLSVWRVASGEWARTNPELHAADLASPQLPAPNCPSAAHSPHEPAFATWSHMFRCFAQNRHLACMHVSQSATPVSQPRRSRGEQGSTKLPKRTGTITPNCNLSLSSKSQSKSIQSFTQLNHQS
jgi:hypothetical protein